MGLKYMITFLLLLIFSSSYGFTNVTANDDFGSSLMVINIGAFIDPNTRIGKEQIVGMEIAAEDLNTSQDKFRVQIQFHSSNSSNPLQAASCALELVQQKRTEAIITGIDNSEEGELLGEIGTKYEVPIFSLSAASSPPPNPNSVVKNRPFFVRMNNNYSSQFSCIQSLVGSFGWKKVIAVYEDSVYGSFTSSMLDDFSQALQGVGSQIEYRLALPPVTIMTDPKDMIMDELVKVYSMQSRVFVVLHSSLSMAIHLFEGANKMGLVGRDTAWIVTDSVASLLDALNASTKSHMKGTLGIKTFYDETTQDYNTFRQKFLLKFLTQYRDEIIMSVHPGIHALRAYDTITTIAKAFESNYTILGNFTGLSGKINIRDGALADDVVSYRVVNVLGKSYKELDIWSQKRGIFEEDDEQEDNHYSVKLNRMVDWPGDIKQVPKGWTMPSTAKPLKVGIPGKPPFDKFIMVKNNSGNQNKTTYSGFCIDVFLEVVKIVEESYGLPYEFEAFDGTYDELVYKVHDKTYDMVVGDVTILANRSKYVEFTQPYTKPGLAMIIPLTSKDSQKKLLFIKPFTWQLWLLSLCILLYTMLAVWWIESRNTSNSDFEGHWTNQLTIALWFTFSSIFFAHRESIKSILTRFIVIAWLFVVFVLISSYNASLTTMLTVPLFKPIQVKSVEALIETNAPVGCDGGSVWDYLVNVKGFNPSNLKNVSSQYDYQNLFNNGSIVAAFVERPYQRLLVNQYCKSFTHTKETFGFGAQGFVFQKGSPIVGDVSKAILKISENGVLKELQDKWFPITSECTTSSNDHEVERLSPGAFLVLYAIYGAISTLCLLFHIIIWIRRYRTSGTINGNLSEFLVMFAQYFRREAGNRRSTQVLPIESSSVTQTNDRGVNNLELINHLQMILT